MEKYKFNIVDYRSDIDSVDQSWFYKRPILNYSRSLIRGAEYFIPNEKLETAINTSIAVGEPLLLTGEPGTGKTQVAYYIAYKLSLMPVLHFQVKSTTKAVDLLYEFDTVRYFHDANAKNFNKTLNKENYIIKKPFWIALENKTPSVLLIDEIDKASRDFPNDLLRELDQMEFDVPELKTKDKEFRVCGDDRYRPIIVITSNSERRLPEPFLRRCIYHYISFDYEVLRKAVKARSKEFPGLSDDFLKLAINRFIELRQHKNLRKIPSTSELLTWLRVLSIGLNRDLSEIKGDLSKLPYLGALLKDHSDLEEIEEK